MVRGRKLGASPLALEPMLRKVPALPEADPEPDSGDRAEIRTEPAGAIETEPAGTAGPDVMPTEPTGTGPIPSDARTDPPDAHPASNGRAETTGAEDQPMSTETGDRQS